MADRPKILFLVTEDWYFCSHRLGLARAARDAGAEVAVVVNALTGLGALFIGGSATARLLGPPVRAALRPLLNRADSHLILQNDDDRALLERHGLIRHDRVHLIRGSGVDVGRFRPPREPDGPPVAALVARMLWDKGVGEFVAAARLLKRRGVAVRLVLAGPTDPENPAAIPEATLRAWQAEG